MKLSNSVFLLSLSSLTMIAQGCTEDIVTPTTEGSSTGESTSDTTQTTQTTQTTDPPTTTDPTTDAPTTTDATTTDPTTDITTTGDTGSSTGTGTGTSTGTDTSTGTTDTTTDTTTGSTTDPGTTGGTTDPGTTGGTDTGDVGKAQIRVIHGASDAPAVDVYVQGSLVPAVAGLSYGQTSAYLEVDAGDYIFEVRAAGSDPNSPAVYTTDVLNLAADSQVSALAAGFITSEAPEDSFRVLAFVEGFAAPQENETRVRIIHAGADAPTVDLDIGNDGSPEVDNLVRFGELGPDGVALPSGVSLQIGVQTENNAPVTAFTTPELPDGGELFVIATGQLGRLPREAAGFSLLVVGPQGTVGFIRQNPTVYVLHAAPDAPNVDVCALFTPLLSDVPYGAMAPIQVPPGAYVLGIFAAPSNCMGMPASFQFTPNLTAGNRYLAAATGELTPEDGDPAFKLSTYIDQFPLLDNENTVFRAVHAASAPAVDIGVVTNGVIEAVNVLVKNLSWPQQSALRTVLPGKFEVGVAGTGPEPLNPLAVFDVESIPGLRAFVVASGALNQAPGEQPFGLVVVDTKNDGWTATPLAPK